MPTRAIPVPVTGDELFAAITEGYAALIALSPGRALSLLDTLEAVLRDNEEHFPQLAVRHDEDEERDYLTLDGDDVIVSAVDISQRWTVADDNLDEETVRFAYDSTSDYVGLVYAVEIGDRMTPVRLPDGWEEGAL